MSPLPDYCECALHCEHCDRPVDPDEYKSLSPPNVPLVVESQIEDGTKLLEPVVTLAVNAQGEVHALVISFDGFVTRAGDNRKEFMVRPQRADDELGGAWS